MSPIQSLCAEVDSLLRNKIMDASMTEEEVNVLRKQEAIEVTVHGQTTQDSSIETLEEKLRAEQGCRRIVVPSTDILNHKANFPLDITHQEAMEDLSEKFNKLTVPKESKLLTKEADIEVELNKHKERQQSAVETSINIAKIVGTSVIPNPPNISLTRRMEREIKEALLDTDSAVHMSLIIQVLKNLLHEGAKLQLQKANKAKWGAMNNRRGQIG